MESSNTIRSPKKATVLGFLVLRAIKYMILLKEVSVGFFPFSSCDWMLTNMEGLLILLNFNFIVEVKCIMSYYLAWSRKIKITLSILNSKNLMQEIGSPDDGRAERQTGDGEVTRWLAGAGGLEEAGY